MAVLRPILTEGIMGTLSNMVLCGSFQERRKNVYLLEFTEPIQQLLLSVTPIQRRKFRRHDFVPVPVLVAMWHLNWLPGKNAPVQRMKILDLTEFLLNNRSYKNDQVEKNAKWLYQTIVKEDVKGRKTFEKKQEYPTFTIQITLENRAKTSVRAR
jgi:hypothetical protein